MAVRSKKELLDAISAYIGDKNDDASLAIIEDITDSFPDNNEDWKKKYEENDAEWRRKYRERFFNGEPGISEEDTTVFESSQKEKEDIPAPTDRSIEDLFD